MVLKSTLRLVRVASTKMWEDLARYLINCAPEVAWDPNLSFAKPNTGASEGRKNHFINYTSIHLERVWKLVEALPEYQPYVGSRARIRPGGGFYQPAREIASWLIAQTKLRDVSGVLNDLRDLLENNKATLIELVALWGINPSNDANVGNGIILSSIGSIPLSYYRDQFSGVQQYVVSEALHQRRMGTAVLQRRLSLAPIFYSGTKAPRDEQLGPSLAGCGKRGWSGLFCRDSMGGE